MSYLVELVTKFPINLHSHLKNFIFDPSAKKIYVHSKLKLSLFFCILEICHIFSEYYLFSVVFKV